MPSDRRRPSHLSTERLVDLLEDRLGASARRAAEEHLGMPCPSCRERLRTLGALLERMRGDQLEAVPEAFHRRAIEVFATRPAPAASTSGPAAWLTLAFDSLRDPLPAATRRAVGEARRLRFVHGAAAIEIECEPESADQCSLRGKLEVPEEQLHRIELRVAGERFDSWADADGAFHFEGVPRGRIELSAMGPSGELRAPPFEC